MNKEVKDQWVAALRSGEYEQGKGTLQEDGKFCCLGVLCELAVKAGVTTSEPREGGSTVIYGGADDPNTAYPPAAVIKWAEMDGPNPYVPFEHEKWEKSDRAPLTALNDNDELG